MQEFGTVINASQNVSSTFAYMFADFNLINSQIDEIDKISKIRTTFKFTDLINTPFTRTYENLITHEEKIELINLARVEGLIKVRKTIDREKKMFAAMGILLSTHLNETCFAHDKWRIVDHALAYFNHNAVRCDQTCIANRLFDECNKLRLKKEQLFFFFIYILRFHKDFAHQVNNKHVNKRMLYFMFKLCPADKNDHEGEKRFKSLIAILGDLAKTHRENELLNIAINSDKKRAIYIIHCLFRAYGQNTFVWGGQSHCLNFIFSEIEKIHSRPLISFAVLAEYFPYDFDFSQFPREIVEFLIAFSRSNEIKGFLRKLITNNITS